jgi:hypothetical protein
MKEGLIMKDNNWINKEQRAEAAVLHAKYMDKYYTFAMNGQTGKMVGNIPVDVKKAIFMWILIFVLSFVAGYIFYYFRGVL